MFSMKLSPILWLFQHVHDLDIEHVSLSDLSQTAEQRGGALLTTAIYNKGTMTALPTRGKRLGGQSLISIVEHP